MTDLLLSEKEELRFSENIEYNYSIKSERDASNLTKMRELLMSVAKPFGRTTEYGHVTATGFVIDKHRRQTLLLHHRKLDIWLPPGGHCDGDSNVLRVALREVEEETGLSNINAVSKDVFDIDIHLIPANKKEPEHYHYDVRFLIEADRDEQIIVNKFESKDLKWIELEQLDLYTDMPSVFILKEKLNML